MTMTTPAPLVGQKSKAFQVLDEAGERGVTYRELNAILGWEHGSSSSALSGLHEERRVARLLESREGCAVYVLPYYVGERSTAPHAAWIKAARDQRERRIVEEFEAKVTLHKQQGAMGVGLPMGQADAVLSVLRRIHPEET